MRNHTPRLRPTWTQEQALVTQASKAWLCFLALLALGVIVASITAPKHDAPGGPSYSQARVDELRLTE